MVISIRLSRSLRIRKRRLYRLGDLGTTSVVIGFASTLFGAAYDNLVVRVWEYRPAVDDRVTLEVWAWSLLAWLRPR